MKKTLYTIGILAALGLLVYFYLINFDNMSETELVNSVLYWYVPLVFGLYGITALRIAKGAEAAGMTSVKYLFSGKDALLLALAILVLVLSGFIGFLVFLLPLVIFKPNNPNFDLFVALTGTFLWLILLYFFFQVLWPAL